MGFRFLYPLLDKAGGLDSLTWLLRDEFTTADPAPLTSPRTCEPGPGTLTAVENDGTLAISGGELVFTAQSTPTWGDSGVYGDGQTLASGLMYHTKANLTSGDFAIAWKEAASVNIAAGGGNRHYLTFASGTGGINTAWLTSAAIVVGTYSTSTEYRVCLIARTNGYFVFIKGGAYTEWTLLFVSSEAMAATVYPVLSSYDSVVTADSFRVAQLPTPWNTDNGIATDDSLTSPSTSDTFTHEADCLIEFEITTIPSAGAVEVDFREQDSANNWRVYITTTGQIGLNERVGGGGTNRGLAAAGLSGGERIVVIADDETITVFYDDTQAFSYSSAANFKTETSGEVNGLGTGGAISDLIAWPRTLSGSTLTELDKYTG